jgi:D-methionine transport system substrate-binding protein
MRRLLTLALALALAAATPARAADAPLRVGSSSGPYAQIMDFVATLAAKQGLPIKVVEFTDYAIPNQAMADGDIDVSNFQNKPYLENAIKARGYDIVALLPTIVVPLGLYSHKLTSIDALKTGDTIAIANDPANGGRGLLLLQQAGLIKLADGANTTATVLDIAQNPKHLKFKELDAAQIPRSLDDVTVAAVNMNYALPAGIDPKSALVRENADTPYGLVWTSLRKNQNDPRIQKLMAIYRSPEVKEYILTQFNGSIVPSW